MARWVGGGVGEFLLFFILVLKFISTAFTRANAMPRISCDTVVAAFTNFINNIILLARKVGTLFPGVRNLTARVID